jgi:hypothetical protein
MADRAACPIVKTLLGKLKLPNARGQANADRASIFGYPYETDDLKLRSLRRLRRCWRLSSDFGVIAIRRRPDRRNRGGRAVHPKLMSNL